MINKHLTLPSLKSKKPQYVLGTENGSVRTSNVTEEMIIDAVYDIEDHDFIYLEKCVPVVLDRYAKAYSIDYYKDSSIAVCFNVNGYMFRMWRSDVDCDLAADILCGFFHSATLPDMTEWQCQKIYLEEETGEEQLCVDGENFRYFDCQDVIGALENIIEGKSRWMLYDFTIENGGYVNIRRCDNDTAPTAGYKVEYVCWTEPNPTGFRGIISDVALLRDWLWSLINSETLPDPMDECVSFDVNNHFERLVFKFLDNDNK